MKMKITVVRPSDTAASKSKLGLCPFLVDAPPESTEKK
jgi:hypothetical protein